MHLILLKIAFSLKLKISESIEGILSDIKESIIEFNVAQPGDKIEHGPNNDPQLWLTSYRRIRDNVRPVLEDIENRFREFFNIHE